MKKLKKKSQLFAFQKIRITLCKFNWLHKCKCFFIDVQCFVLGHCLLKVRPRMLHFPSKLEAADVSL